MAVREWIAAVGAKTAYIERGSPWENGYCSLNSKLHDELLNGEIFYTLQEAKVIIENWRRHYNTIRPHSSLGYRPPAPEAFMPARPAPQQPTELIICPPEFYLYIPAFDVAGFRKTLIECSHVAPIHGDEPAWRNPITGIAGCCARAASGHAAAGRPVSI